MPSSELIDKLKALVGTGDEDDSLLADDLALAVELVDRYLADFGLTDSDGGQLAPDVVQGRATIQVAADLFDRRKFQTTTGDTAFTGEDGQAPIAVPFNRDPIASARDLLRPYVLEVNIA